MRFGPQLGDSTPRPLVSMREKMYLAVMIFLALVMTFMIASLMRETQTAPPGDDAATAPEDPSPAEPAAGPSGEEPPSPEEEPGPDQEPPPFPIAPEFRQEMAVALQQVQDETPEIEGKAFDYLVSFARRVGWEELNREADPDLLEQIVAGTDPAKMAPQVRDDFRKLWARSRGRVVDFTGEVFKTNARALPAKIDDVSTIHEVWILKGGQFVITYVLDLNAAKGDTVVVRGLFYKYAHVELATGGEGDFPILVAKTFGLGARLLSPEEETERRILSGVKDLTEHRKIPALFHLLRKLMTLSEEAIDEAVVPGLLDTIWCEQRVAEKASPRREELLNDKAEVWKENRGTFLRVTGTLRSIEEQPLPTNAVPGLAAVHWGQIVEDETDRIVYYIVADPGEFEVGRKVTIEGAFLKMGRWEEYTKDEPKTLVGYIHLPYIVGRTLEQGVVYPVFGAEQLPGYLERVRDRDDSLRGESYYYLLWWLDNHAKPEDLAAAADPELGNRLQIGRNVTPDEEEIARYEKIWSEARGKPLTVQGRLVYLDEEELSDGRMPEGYPRRNVSSGFILLSNYRKVGFTVLDKGAVEKDRGVRITGVFYKYWRFPDRKGGRSETIYVLGHSIEPVEKGKGVPFSRPIVIGFLGVTILTLAGLSVAWYFERRGERRGRPAGKARRPKAAEAPPALPETTAPLPGGPEPEKPGGEARA